MVFSLVTTLVGELALTTLVFDRCTNTFQTSTLVLPAVGTIVRAFKTGFAHEGLAESGVYVGGVSAPQRIYGRCVNCLFAVCSEDVWIVGLAASFVHAVGGV
jgi:hypothetical protein